MPAGLWGRAESTRTVLRSLAQALAPVMFGGLSQLIAGIAPAQAPVGTHTGVISPSTARGLEISFLLLVSTLAAAGVFLLRARSTYPRDVATAAASNQGSPDPPEVREAIQEAEARRRGRAEASRAPLYHRLTAPGAARPMSDPTPRQPDAEPTTGPGGPPALRASDADRERVVDILRQAAGDGRLDVDELDERLQRIYATKTVAELRPLIADLTPAEALTAQRSRAE